MRLAARLPLQLLYPEGERLAREVGPGARDLDERELEGEARVAALAHIVDGDGEEIDEANHVRFADLVRLSV
jgi:hypothetical protein